MTPLEWSRIQQGIFSGESGGDYGALFGYQNRPNGQFAGTDLTKMTVDQALDFADPNGPYGQYVKGQVGRVATPMGAYQVVGTTLRDAKEALGLTGDEVMNQELQDRIGQWVYKTQGTDAWEGYKPINGDKAIAEDTMRVLGKQPKGLLAADQTTNKAETKMIPEEKPKGLLGSLGIQKMVEGAEGETGQRFFQRETFKDTAARMAPLLAAMGSSPALQKATANVAAQRTEAKARNKSLEFLASLPNGEEYVRIAEVAGPRAAMQAYLESRKAPKDTRTSAMKNYSEYQRILAEQGPEAAEQFRTMSKSGTTINTGDMGANKFIEAQMNRQAEQYSAYSEGAMAAQDALSNLSIMEQLASQPGFYSGTLAEKVVQLKKAAVAMGADPDLVKNEETFNAIAKKTALDVMGGSLGVGFSNADRDFVTSMVPGLENTRAGNAEIIDIQRKLQQRRIDLAVLSDQYSTENGNLTGFTKFIKKWAEENPLFTKVKLDSGISSNAMQFMTPKEP